MNDLTLFLNHSGLHRLGWALLHSLWQGAVGAILFAALRAGLRRHSANVRYSVACLILALIAAAPVLTIYSGAGAGGLWPPDPSRAGAAWAQTASVGAGGETARLGGAGDGLELWAGAGVTLERVLPWLVLGWLLGVGALSCRWIQGSCWLRSVKRVGTARVDECWLERLAAMKRRLNISRPVQLLRSALVEVPMVTGWLRPVILLPASTLSGLSPAQVDAILAHELAHIRRLDYLVNAFQNLVETLMFYHPAVWWISRCIREERELCCDDIVVSVCGDRVNYARALYTLETLRGHPRLAFAASGGSLLCRIRRLLGTPSEAPATAREFGGLTLVGIGCMLLVAGTLLMLRPATYQATAVIKLDPESSRPAVPTGNQSSRTYYDPYFVQTELAVMRSPAVLKRVVAALEPLRADVGRFQDRTAMARIRSRLAIRQVPSTTLVELVASDENAAGAARLANAVAAGYEQYCAEQRRRLLQESQTRLAASIVLSEAQVSDAQKQVNELRAELKIPVPAGDDPVSDSRKGPWFLNAETLRRIESLRIESKAELVRYRTLLEKLKRFKQEELPQAIVVASPDTLLSSLFEQLNLSEQKLVALSREFGPDHLERVKVAAQVRNLQDKVRVRTEGIMIGLSARVESMERSLQELEKQVQEATTKDIELAGRIGPCLEAKKNLEGQQRFRQMLLQKTASERADLDFSGSMPGLIVEQAIAPQRRVNPDRDRAGALMGSGLLSVLIGAWLGRSGRRTFAVEAVAA